ncbi:reverse transcriptase [Senna tora]|uniref:Reverse transcriptase n=1 Tax=Senna tora TaxID=362788 RepID=A0A834XG70_9FABA|nr:reverse transcriptase [Senna tora]
MAQEASARAPTEKGGSKIQSWADMVELEEISDQLSEDAREGTSQKRVMGSSLAPKEAEGHEGHRPMSFTSNSTTVDHAMLKDIRFGSFNPFLTPNTSITPPSIPRIQLSDADNQALHSPWSESLIVRLQGMIMDINNLQRRLQLIWKLKGLCSLLELGQGYFLLSFNLSEDRWKALLHGPCLTNGCLLSIRIWTPCFSPIGNLDAFSPVWIRLEGLPLEFYNKKLLVQIRNSLGTFLGLDSDTHNIRKARYARLCILLNVSKTPAHLITIGTFNQSVIYEKMPPLASSPPFKSQVPYRPKEPQLTKKTNDWVLVERKKWHKAQPLDPTPSTIPAVRAVSLQRKQIQISNKAQCPSSAHAPLLSKPDTIITPKTIKFGKPIVPPNHNLQPMSANLTESCPEAVVDPSSSKVQHDCRDLEPITPSEVTRKWNTVDAGDKPEPILKLNVASVWESLVSHFSTQKPHRQISSPSLQMILFNNTTHQGLPNQDPNTCCLEQDHASPISPCFEASKHRREASADRAEEAPCPTKDRNERRVCRNEKIPLILHSMGRLNGHFVQQNQIDNLSWSQYASNQALFNNPRVEFSYPLKAQAWALLISDAQMKKTECSELKFWMKGMRNNFMILVLPPRVLINGPAEIEGHRLTESPMIWNGFVKTAQIRVWPVQDVLKGDKSGGLLFRGSWYHREVDVSAITSLKLDVGRLDYTVRLNTTSMWDEDIQYDHFESSGSDNEMVGQNFNPNLCVMDQFSVMAWNARGAAGPGFKRVFREMMLRYKPTVVLVTETRVAWERANKIIDALDFNNFYRVDPMGYAGGMWLLWNEDAVKVTIGGFAFQEIHASIKVNNLDPFLLSCVYASPDRARRKILWENMKNLAATHSLPWLVCGDFNEVMSQDEKWGIRPASDSRIREFKDCVDTCGLFDLGYVGQKYTWCNKRDGNLVYCRLDRFLANGEWVNSFPNSVNHHLPRIKSDHCPILLNYSPDPTPTLKRPFRCEKIWLNQPGFANIVREVWRDPIPIDPALISVKNRALRWNRISFGNIHSKKNLLIKRLEGIARAPFPTESLFRLAKTLSEVKNWIPAKIDNIKISHLIYADDVLLFSRCDTRSIRAVKSALDRFLAVSDLSINNSKSSCWFSPSTPDNLKSSVVSFLGFKDVPYLGNYLGFPLGTKNRKSNYNFILDKIKNKISAWKTKYLSFGGKWTLISSVTSSISAYFFQGLPIPKSVCDDIDRIHRDFLWGSSNAGRKIHFIGWEKICRPKTCGGLGLMKAFERNNAFLAKLLWRVNQEEGVWARLCKYRLSLSLSSASTIGKCLARGRDIYEKGKINIIFSGANTNFWSDAWISPGPIRSLIQGPLTLGECKLTVAEVYGISLDWQSMPISFSLLDSILNHKRVVPLNPLSDRMDFVAWKGCSNGNFDLKTAYTLALNIKNSPPPEANHNNFSWIWKLNCHFRIQVFFWRLAHNAIACRGVLASKITNFNSLCPLCLTEEESLQYLFSQCRISNDVWQRVSRIIKPKHANNFVSWLRDNASCSDYLGDFKVPHGTIFAYLLWHIWVARNNKVFNNLEFSPRSVGHLAVVRAAEFASFALDLTPPRVVTSIDLHWTPPPIGSGCSFQAELWSFLLGLQRAKDLGIDCLEIEYDCKGVVDFVIMPTVVDAHPLAPLINLCRSSLLQLSQVSVKHIYREKNGCSDLLAKHAARLKLPLTCFDVMPAFLSNCFWADLLGVSRSRRVLVQREPD